jgi:hypothetical protein
LNSRAFSIAMTAWSAKVLSNWTWCAENRPGFFRPTSMTPITIPLPFSGEHNMLRNPCARAISRNAVSPVWVSVSVISTASPACASSKCLIPAIGRGKRAFNISSAAGLVDVNASR